MEKAYFVLGLNGSGKSTYRELINLNDLVIIDADKIKKDLNCSEIEAGRKAIKLFDDCIKNKKSFLIESTLTSKNTFNQMTIAKNNHYKINCVFIGLESLNEHIDRVANRVQNGGHDISIDTIKRRFDKSYGNVKKLFELSDSLTVLDNTDKLTKQFELKNGIMKRVKEAKIWVIENVIIPYNNKSFNKNRNEADKPVSKEEFILLNRNNEKNQNLDYGIFIEKMNNFINTENQNKETIEKNTREMLNLLTKNPESFKTMSDKYIEQGLTTNNTDIKIPQNIKNNLNKYPDDEKSKVFTKNIIDKVSENTKSIINNMVKTKESAESIKKIKDQFLSISNQQFKEVKEIGIKKLRSNSKEKTLNSEINQSRTR